MAISGDMCSTPAVHHLDLVSAVRMVDRQILMFDDRVGTCSTAMVELDNQTEIM
jgi:hypothetical protein